MQTKGTGGSFRLSLDLLQLAKLHGICGSELGQSHPWMVFGDFLLSGSFPSEIPMFLQWPQVPRLSALGPRSPPSTSHALFACYQATSSKNKQLPLHNLPEWGLLHRSLLPITIQRLRVAGFWNWLNFTCVIYGRAILIGSQPLLEAEASRCSLNILLMSSLFS